MRRSAARASSNDRPGASEQGQRDGSVREDVSFMGLALLFMDAMQITLLAQRTRAVGMDNTVFDVLNMVMAASQTPMDARSAPEQATLPLDSTDDRNATNRN